MTIGNPFFCLALHLTGVLFQDKLQHVDHVGAQKFKSRPIRTREILSDCETYFYGVEPAFPALFKEDWHNF